MSAAPAFDLITAGNACVDIFVPAHEPPPRGGMTKLESLGFVPGGNAANTAITASRCGVRTAVAGVLGDDLHGRHLRDTFADEGIDTSLLRLLAGRSSPATLVFNDATGERSFVHHPGTNADYRLPPATLDAPTRVFHFAAPELLAGLWVDGALAAARQLRDAGRTLTLDTFAVEGELSPAEIARTHRPFLELIDMAFPNESEARLVTGRTDVRDMAAHLHDLGVRVVAVKRGERGALVSWPGGREEVPAATVRVMDTCGAGDSFAAGFITGHLWGLAPIDCARLGCALGTLCVQFEGSTTGSADIHRFQPLLAPFRALKTRHEGL